MELRKVILITGASSGIGAATARLFAKKGFATVLAARRLDRLEKLSQEIRENGGEALAVQTDISMVENIQHLVDTILKHYGRLDVLFNNAGFGRLNWLENLGVEKDIRAQVEVNLLGVILTTRAVLPHMISRKQGHIINMGSIASFIATPTYSIYAASKFGVRGFTEALRREVSIFGVRVTLICPGGVETEFGEIAGFQRTTRVTTPRFLVLHAEDVAHAVWRATVRYRHTVVLPPVMRFAIWLNALLPGFLDLVMEHMFVRKERSSSLV